MSLAAIFKAYDVRGIYPEEFDEMAAARVGRAFASYTDAPEIVVGRDCRASSPSLSEAFIEGVTAAGANVVDIGLATTDMLYFVSGSLDRPGAMFTASHNPPNYNGLKLCGPGAAPIGEETGLVAIRELAEAPQRQGADRRGSVTRRDMREPFVEHVLSFVDVDALEPLTVVADAANGMAGLVLEPVFDRLPMKLIGLFLELDGTFPNHPPDPIQPENQEDLKRAVAEHGADVGLAFDGDADRLFLVDEVAAGVSGSLVTALVAETILGREQGAAIVYNLICSWTVPEVIRENGGKPVRTRVGHSFIKQVMAETGAAFGGEHSGHYYFRDHYRADSGLIAALMVLERLSRKGVPLSELLAPYRRYHASGEINREVDDQAETIERVASAFADGRHDRTDGLTVEYEDWWFNVRPSNTEPLLRLNAEARTPELLEARTESVLAVIAEGAKGKLPPIRSD